jgi:hypothetical protein
MGKLSPLLTTMQYTSLKTSRADGPNSQFHLLNFCTARSCSSKIFTICLTTPFSAEQMIYTHGADMARCGAADNFRLHTSCSQNGCGNNCICANAVYSFTSVNLRTCGLIYIWYTHLQRINVCSVCACAWTCEPSSHAHLYYNVLVYTVIAIFCSSHSVLQVYDLLIKVILCVASHGSCACSKMKTVLSTTKSCGVDRGGSR